MIMRIFKSTIIMLLFPFLVFSQDVKNILRNMPQEDYQALNRLFYWMINRDNLAYTLFGDKPISFSSEFVTPPIGNILMGQKRGLLFWKYWNIWEKYEKQFIYKNYVLIKEPSIGDKNTIKIILINKKAFLEKVNNHLEIFKKFLGKNLTAETLLSNIEKNKKFSVLIKNNQLLWGLLLGYGLKNSELYYQRSKLEQFLMDDSLPLIPEKIISANGEFSSLEEEYEFIDSQLSVFGDHGFSLKIMHPVNFVASSEDDETKLLKNTYEELRSKISSIYADKNFLEVTLSKLTENN